MSRNTDLESEGHRRGEDNRRSDTVRRVDETLALARLRDPSRVNSFDADPNHQHAKRQRKRTKQRRFLADIAKTLGLVVLDRHACNLASSAAD